MTELRQIEGPAARALEFLILTDIEVCISSGM